MIVSPLDNFSETVLVNEIEPEFIIKEYEKAGIDVSCSFRGISKVFVYKCLKTGYIFFYPLNLAGDGFFYEKLMRYDWYYNPWKWEHEFCKELIGKGSEILEVGCAKGDFLFKVRNEIGVGVTGLELNKQAIEEGKKKGVPIFGETIQEHAVKNFCKYDLVCSFQVLEHISDVNSFLQAQVDCLKKDGKLVIAVPNNNSFIKNDRNGILNLPPHHMGHWDPDSIKSLESIYNIKLEGIYFEPLQESHFSWYYFVQMTRFQKKYSIWGKLIEKCTKPFYKPFLRLTSRFINGHTMLAVFIK